MMRYTKCLVAGLSVAVAAAIPLVGDGVSVKDGLIVFGAFLAGGFPTWAVPTTLNKPQASRTVTVKTAKKVPPTA